MKQTELYKKIAKLTTKNLLLSLFDITALFGTFDHRRRYRRAYNVYLDQRSKDYQQLYRLVSRLKTLGLINIYMEGKNKFIELTPAGRTKITNYLFTDQKILFPKVWDGKWRIVIFDIPEYQKDIRKVIRELFRRVGFYQLQKSVYIFPHDCIQIIRYIEEIYDIDEYIQFIIAERVETEEDLISIFHKKGIIKKIKK